MREARSGRVRAVLLIWLAMGGCANEQAPPGALPDRRPPQVARLTPGRDAVVPGFGGPARIRFDEPVNLGRGLGNRVQSSPAYEYAVEIGFSEVRIRPRGGWRPGAVYCFSVPAGIADLLGNRTAEPIDFCFSTGPPVSTTLVEGKLEDRLTGRAVQGGRVLFLALPGDTTPYTAVADGQGAFALRALPSDTYWAYGFQDRNRNLRLDRLLEPYDSVRFTVAEGVGTAPLALSVVEPDSTPPRLLAAVAEDSLTIRLEVDDPLELEQPDAVVTVTDSSGREIPSERLHVGDRASLRRLEAAARADTTRARADTARARTDTARAAAPPPPRPGAQALAPRRPSGTLLILLGEALQVGPYRVRAAGLVNLRGLVGGGDTTFVYPPEETPAGPSPGRRPGGPENGGRGAADGSRRSESDG